MITTRIIGRIAKDSKIGENEYGKSISIELAVDDYYNEQNSITWVSVYSNRNEHLNLVEQLIKDKLILIEGTLNLSIRKYKNKNYIQISVNADYIYIVNGQENNK